MVRKKDLLGVVDSALRLEGKKREFYLASASATDDKNGKTVFKYLADEESEHITRLQKIRDALAVNKRFLEDEKSPSKTRKCSIRLDAASERALEHKALKNIIPEKTLACASDLCALKTAVEIESESVVFYRKAVGDVCGEDGRRVLQLMLEEEEEHLRSLRMQYAFLEANGFWYDVELPFS